MFIRHFDAFRTWLELDDHFHPMRVVEESDGLGESPSFGFFVAEPELLFVAPSETGPVLGWRDRLVRVGNGARLLLEGTGRERRLVVDAPDREHIEVTAPESDLIDPTLLDEPDMSDFYLWLATRLPMPHVQAQLTSTPVGQHRTGMAR
jgi:hypothetical protein